MIPLLFLAVLTLLLVSQNSAFSPIATKHTSPFHTSNSPSQYHYYKSVPSLFAIGDNTSATSTTSTNEPAETDGTTEDEVDINALNALPPALPASDNDPLQPIANDTDYNPVTPSAATTTFMITNEMKRILIEELGYQRQEVNQIRIELVDSIISKRISRPVDGMPSTWYIKEEEETSSQSTMLKKLENESKYPLKVPLLGVSLVLSGKGLSDALVTVIKVNMGFNGVSLMEEFMGVPVLAIDFVSVVVGVGLGVWTWKNMRD